MSSRKKKKSKSPASSAAATATAAAPTKAAASSQSSPSSSSLPISGAADTRTNINAYFTNLISQVKARHDALLKDLDRTTAALPTNTNKHIVFQVDEDDSMTGMIARLGRVHVQDQKSDAAHSHSHGHGHGGGGGHAHHHDEDDHGHSHGHGHSHSHGHGGHDDDHCHGHAHGAASSDHGHSHGHGAPPAAAAVPKGPIARSVVIKHEAIYGGRVEVRESKQKGKYWVALEAIPAGTKLYEEAPSLLTAPYPVGFSTPPDVKDALSRCLLQHPTLAKTLYCPSDLTDYPCGPSPDASLATDEQWRRAAAQVQINGFNVNIGDGTCRCFVYDLMSALNHSCWPNADKIDDVNGPAACWTIRDIAAGEEICISYSNEMLRQPRASRQSYLSRMWRFNCTCDRCEATADITLPPPSPALKPIWTQLRALDALLVAGERKATDEHRRVLDELSVAVRHLSPADATNVSKQMETLLTSNTFADTHWRIQPVMLQLIEQLPQTHQYRPFALWLLKRMAGAWKLTLPRLSTAHIEMIRQADIWHDTLDEGLAFLQPYYDKAWTQKLLDMYSTLGDGKVTDM